MEEDESKDTPTVIQKETGQCTAANVINVRLFEDVQCQKLLYKGEGDGKNC